jgi:glutamyl-tRNA synthetase
MGFLPAAMRNYLVRLGWAHGDDEIFSTEQATEWFSLAGVGRSPARFDMQKLTALNGHYMREAEDGLLVDLLAQRIAVKRDKGLDEDEIHRLTQGMAGLKERAKTVVELLELAEFYVADRPLPMTPKALKSLDEEGKAMLGTLAEKLASHESWDRETLEALARQISEEMDVKLGKAAQPIRAALTGSTVSPPIFEVMEILGREETLGRVSDAQNAEI